MTSPNLEDLINYLRKNANSLTNNSRAPEFLRHEGIRNRIKQNPSLIGIAHYEDIQSFDEVRFSKQSYSITPDIIFVADYEVYIVKIKIHKSKETTRNTAKKLQIVHSYIKSIYGIFCYPLIVFGTNGDRLDVRSLNFRI